jgi:hypothetical protein
MVSNREAASSREPRVASGCLCALVLLGTWFAVGGASGQVPAPEGATSWQPRTVALNPAVLDNNARPGLRPLLRSVKPKVRGALAPAVRRRLALALPMAMERVYRIPTCRALFTALRADGVLKLANLRYHPATWPEEARPCQSGNAALQIVGTPNVRLCELFARLDTDVAALILIHEALHTAGLGEKPLDPNGLSTGEISIIVKTSCGF